MPTYPVPLTGVRYVDLCLPPYGHVPGDDVTNDLQNLIINANATNTDLVAYFSKSGTYNINGAPQSGAGYNAQIVLPARHFTAGSVGITIKGSTPSAIIARGRSTEGPPEVPSFGVVLQSNNNTAGVSIFACAAADSGFSDYALTFEDICVRAPSDPQGSGIDGTQVANLSFRGYVSVDTVDPSAPALGSPKTGTGTGVIFPVHASNGMCRQSGSMEVMGWPNGIQIYDHVASDHLYVGRTNNAVLVGLSKHWNTFNHLLVQDCQNVITGQAATGQIYATIDYGDTASGQAFVNLINDASNFLVGEIHLLGWNNVATYAVNGATGIKVVDHARVTGFMNGAAGRVPPAVPASTTPQTNTFGRDAWVIVTGGTVSVIAVDGQTTGLTSGPILVPNNKSITLTYTVAPTWNWFLF